MNFLLDSDRVASYLKNIHGAVQLLGPLFSRGCAISVITYAEIFEGILGGHDRDEAERAWMDLLESVDILAVDTAIADRFARIRAELRTAGRLIPDMDLLIAATAIEYDLTLVTGNRRHFDRIPGLEILS